MSVLVGEDVTAHVLAGESLPYVPRLDRRDRSLVIGPYFSSEEHERHVLETTGSVDWFSFSGQDEMRFAEEKGHMASLWFRVPDEPAAVSSIGGWLDVPVVAELPGMLTRRTPSPRLDSRNPQE